MAEPAPHARPLPLAGAGAARAGRWPRRFPLRDGGEFSGLTTSYFGTRVCCYLNLGLAKTEAFATLLGPTRTNPRGLPELSGYFAPELDAAYILAGGFFYPAGSDPAGSFGAYDQDSLYLPSLPPSPTRGSFLVRASGVAVPEPASLALAGTGLAALALTRRRRTG